ncbi:MAG: aspartate-semialdehyde dehydrogenase [Anaerolineales bacterium]
MPKIKVAVLGATGAVGQRFVQLLEHHPWFEVAALTGSDRTVGQRYGDGCRWILPQPMPAGVRDLVVLPTEPGFEAALAFSALPAEIARDAEPALAAAGYGVCSNASAYRMAEDVPLIIPEVNPDHTALIDAQRRGRGWSGFLLTNPNCTSTGLTIAFKALQARFGLKRAVVVSLQAVSGAGYPGVPSLDILDNVVPYIGGEEDKVETEPRKMLGKFEHDAITPAELRLSAHTNRVAVSDGHTVCVSVEFDAPAAPEAVIQCLAEFAPPEIVRGLPSAPNPAIVVRTEPDRPQPAKDRHTGGGMTTVVGRVRVDPLFHSKFIVLSHNTIHGAAGGAILNGELLVAQGYLKRG